MRNLLKYPISAGEVISLLDTIPINETQIGGTDRMIKRGIMKYFSQHPEKMQELVKEIGMAQ
jgi:hypothetical protein